MYRVFFPVRRNAELRQSRLLRQTAFRHGARTRQTRTHVQEFRCRTGLRV